MRYARVAITGVGAAIILFFLCSWVMSYFTFVRMSIPLSERALVCVSYRGQLSAVVVPINLPEIWWERGNIDVPGNTVPDQLWPRECVLGFGWITETLYLNGPNSPVP